ncbi:MAG: EAL domain-containing protein, partial [Chromatocurvus sp.]
GASRPSAWVLVNVRPLLDRAGSLARIVVSFTDITSMKTAEEELMLAAEVFETAAEGIIISDAEGGIINVNRAFTEITGYSFDDVKGKTPAILRSSAHDEDFYERLWEQLRATGSWRGERTSRRKDGAHFHEMLSINAITDASGEIARYIGVFSDITLLKQQQAELEHQAYYDALTGVPNRTLGIESLKLAMQQCQRRGRLVAVAYIDLDNFKEVNDSHGHEVGDNLLKILAARMQVALREGDTLARIGGDEFVAVLCDLQRETDCLPIVERLLSLSTEPATVGEQVLSPTASVGISFYPQGDATLEAEQLLRQADHAMYQAKTEGRNCFRLFDKASNQLLEDKHQLVNDVRRGLAANEFILHYQPKVDLVSGEIRGAEALIRWQHPELGLLSPARFLLPLENHSVLIDLGNWVIDQALRDLSSLPESQRDLAVSVNISPPHLLVEGFADSIRDRLAAYPALDGRQLELEILETSALENTRDVAEVISRCAEFGVHFALDDFGSGYSSLVYLQALPIDTLKIDQTFVRNMTHESADLAILRAIVSLAKALDIRIVAEGAETEEHCRLLRALGCGVAQGYAFARPMSLAELIPWLNDWVPSQAFPADSAAARSPAAVGTD